MTVTWQWILPEGPHAVAAARREIASVTAGRDDREDAVLVASELCTNALLHGRPPIVLRALIDDALLRIEVENRRDGATLELGGPRPMPGPSEVGGRGLALVQAVAEDWGSEDADGATRVWAELRANR